MFLPVEKVQKLLKKRQIFSRKQTCTIFMACCVDRCNFDVRTQFLTRSTHSMSGTRTVWLPSSDTTQDGVSGLASIRASTASAPILQPYMSTTLDGNYSSCSDDKVHIHFQYCQSLHLLGKSAIRQVVNKPHFKHWHINKIVLKLSSFYCIKCPVVDSGIKKLKI